MNTETLKLAAILRLATFASLLSLAAAFTAQYGFGLAPCHLCIAQRVPFAVVIMLALFGLRRPQQRSWIVLTVGAAFLINSGIAGYHTAVEKHWVSGPSGCTQEPAPAGQSMDDFLKRIKAAPIVSCDQPQWEWHDITMAGMNAAWCLLLAAGTLIGWRNRHAPTAG